MGAACISDTPEARKTERMETAPQTSRGSYRSLAARSLAIVLLVAFAALLALPLQAQAQAGHLRAHGGGARCVYVYS